MSIPKLILLLAVASSLPKRHQDWLTRETSYLITRAERDAFLALKTDQERDGFVERFWEIRNPTPGAGQNEFKEEFYRRVAYANATFGRDAGSDGWRTDRGRTYILFGRPQTVMDFHGNQELYPTELWFYSNPGLSELPPFFYVLFYEKDGAGGFRLYHPYVDGPNKLVRSRPTKSQAYNYLRGVNAELARATLTLIPGEPVDTDTFSGSMSSADVLNAINGYNQMHSYVALIQERRRLAEQVATRVDYDLPRADLVTLVAYEKGDPWLHWQVEIRDPLALRPAGYEVAARLYSKGRLVFERTDSPGVAGEERRPWIYEDRMPVVEGAYRLQVNARNKASGRVYEASKDITVRREADRPTISDILVVPRHEPDTRERSFGFGGVKFFPTALRQVVAASGLQICYQVVLNEPRPSELQVEYVIGNVASRFRQTLQDRLDTRLADASGSLITAKLLPIRELAPGAYQLSVQVKDPQTGKVSARSAGFRVIAELPEQPVIVSPARSASSQWRAATEYERALCWLAQDRPREALAALEVSRSWSRNASVEGLMQHLQERIKYQEGQ